MRFVERGVAGRKKHSSWRTFCSKRTWQRPKLACLNFARRGAGPRLAQAFASLCCLRKRIHHCIRFEPLYDCCRLSEVPQLRVAQTTRCPIKGQIPSPSHYCDTTATATMSSSNSQKRSANNSQIPRSVPTGPRSLSTTPSNPKWLSSEARRRRRPAQTRRKAI